MAHDQQPVDDGAGPLRAEVQLLLDFAIAQAVVTIADEVISEVLVALENKEPWTADKKAALWKARNKLTILVRPATSESIRAISALTRDQEKRPGFLRSWSKDPLVRGQAFSSIAWVVVTVVILVLAQFYALSISSILSNIEQAEKSYTEAVAQRTQLELRLKAEPSSDQALQRERDAWDQKATFEESAIISNYALLDRWGSPFSWAVPSVEGQQDQIGLRNVAQVFLKAFALYLLPLLYGLFGANVYILRQLIVKLDSWSLNGISVTKHHLRRALGSVLGGTVGLLFEDNNGISSIGFGLATLAFLAGYSSELVFSLLDSFITKAKQAFAPAKSYEPESNGKAPSK